MSKLTPEQVAHKTEVLEDSATKAVYELQLGKDKAIRFILKNVKGSNVKQARKALTFVCTSYKADEPDYEFS
tara:strand:+ start:306 stop:521 length:216 start_codon:yes stop_codon:yes gene_type:complete